MRRRPGWATSSRGSSSCSEDSRELDCKSNNQRGWCVYAAVGLVAVGAYSNALAGDFVHDDIPAVVRNRDVIGENPIFSVLADDFWGTPMQDLSSHKSYRPLTTFTFRFVVL